MSNTGLYPSNLQPAIYIPAEYEPVSAVMVSWSPFPPHYWITYANLIRELVKSTKAIIIVSNRDEQVAISTYLKNQKIDPVHNITFLHIPFNSIWIRDYGPLYTISNSTPPQLTIVDTRYEPLYRPRLLKDDSLPLQIATIQVYQRTTLDLILEGGNLLSDGHGTCFATATILYRNTNYSSQEIRAMMQQATGCQNLVVLPALYGEPTGHIGLVLKILSPDTLLVGQCTHELDRNCKVLDKIADKLKFMNNYAGQPYKIVRIPYPFVGLVGRDWLYASYVNSIIVNRRVFIPAFGLPEDEIALQIYRDALPEYTIIPVDTSPLVRAGGAIQCITVTIPDLSPKPEVIMEKRFNFDENMFLRR